MNIFEGRDIRVVARLFDECTDQLVITFTGRAAAPPVEKGFGETFLLKRRVSAVHFISKDNHWWQTPEPMAAIAELRKRRLIGGDRRVTLYGSSMGGYAALILSRAIRPSRIVIFSPQYSIDAKLVPFEKRWRSYAARLTFDHDDMAAGIDHQAELMAVYDPFFEPDRRHVDLIERHRSIVHVPVSFAGHNTARTLEELGIIKDVIEALLFGDFDIGAFRRLYRRTRSASSLFWYGLSQTLSHFGHSAGSVLAAAIATRILIHGGRMKDHVLRLDILRHGIATACEAEMPGFARRWLTELERVETNAARLAFTRAIVARAEGAWAEVGKQAEKALGRKRDDAVLVAMKAEALQHTGGTELASGYLGGLAAPLRRAPAVLRVQAHLLADADDPMGALEAMRRYFRHEPWDQAARVFCARCWDQAGRPEGAIKQLSPVLHYNIAGEGLSRQVVELVEKARGSRHAAKIKDRHDRFSRLFQGAMSILDKCEWGDRERMADGLAGLRNLKASLRRDPTKAAAMNEAS